MFYKVFLSALLIIGSFTVCEVKADSFILMIGDGMGKNHLRCAAQDKPLYITSLPVKGWVQTRSADNEVTDSAASATAYACGIKTNNRFLGKRPDGSDCRTIAEECVEKGLAVGIYSTDYSTGATPSAFYAHVPHRKRNKEIEEYKAQAGKTMDIQVPVEKISDEVEARLEKLKNTNKDFFVMFEGARIDTESHQNNLNQMKQELYDFDLAVMKATNFVYHNPDATLVVLADHETGGLTDDCEYTVPKHTGQDVPLHAYGKHAELFEGVQDNTEINKKMKQILFSDKN